jgi:hypothetical protein
LTTTIKHSSAVVGALVPLGDYLREHQLVTGYGFNCTPNGVVCQLQGCRFANIVHQTTDGSVACAACPIFQLVHEALEKGATNPSLRDHKILVEEGVTCVFDIALRPGMTDEDGR